MKFLLDTDHISILQKQSGPEYAAAGVHAPTPETSPGACANETVSGARYQPFASGARLAAAVTAGADASYCSASEPELVLPARSVQLPGVDAVAESGPLYVLPPQDAMPEVA